MDVVVTIFSFWLAFLSVLQLKTIKLKKKYVDVFFHEF
ncbi:hypothetical protein JCM19300_3596 [Algibacter lectus]|uniref:Uncharacterized protein n=1 Tax=Algibacter lectus TaxID=221126 RepID=A0A090V932_9FLAO|nr:hypothetical protein JCM19300_3596 [Algibacter lectus]